MNILALETTGKYGSASVITDDGRLFSAKGNQEMNHLRGMIALIDEAVQSAGISKSELTHIAASVGPGSFTGIRIGVVTARTLSQFLGIPCIAVSSLKSLALAAADIRCEGDAVIVPIINARRHQAYGAAYKAEGMEVLFEERQYMIEELLELLNEYKSKNKAAFFVFTGDGIDAYEDIIKETLDEGSFAIAGEEERYQHSDSVARIALEKAAGGETLSYDELMPEYMRLAEAEQKLKAGTLSDKITKALT